MSREKKEENYNPSDGDKKELEVLSSRINILKEKRKSPLPGSTRSWEDIAREADAEFTPHELGFAVSDRKRLISDDDQGLRSRMVKVGEDDNWQSNVSSCDFYTKVATAVSILIDMNPEAVFEPASRKYKETTLLAYKLWKKSWDKDMSRQQMKLFTFNLAKYGIAFGKTYPRIIKNKKGVKFNDLCRRSWNPWQVWMSDTARLGDPYSYSDWYYEIDYDKDTFAQDLPEADFPNAKFVKPGMMETKGANVEGDKDKFNDKITVGFYENDVTNKFDIWVPSTKILLHSGELPNDDGMKSVWFAPWSIRDDRTIYGIGIFEIIRNDKVLYDKLANMTMDQLALSIYKMFFHKGVDVLGENGTLRVSPGRGEQVMDPQSVTWMNVPGPGPEAWKGMEYQRGLIDQNSGVPVQLSGTFGGKTLGQDLQAKETALERLKTPLDFICDALQQEAYISLSWMNQIYSTPEVLEWNTPEDLGKALEEMGMAAADIVEYLKEAKNPNPNGNLLYQEPPSLDEKSGMSIPGKKKANVYKEVSIKAGQDTKTGKLFEDDKDRFFRFGLDISTSGLDWKGIVKIIPQSILRPSKELSKRNDLDLFNLVFPSIQTMATNPMMVPVLMPPIKQILKVYEKDIKDWIDEEYFNKLFQDASAPHDTPPEVKTSLSIAFKDILSMLDPTQKEVMKKYLGIKVEEPLFVDKASMAGNESAKSLPGGSPITGAEASPVNAKEGISPVADLKPAPTTLGGAVEGSTNMV